MDPCYVVRGALTIKFSGFSISAGFGKTNNSWQIIIIIQPIQYNHQIMVSVGKKAVTDNIMPVVNSPVHQD